MWKDAGIWRKASVLVFVPTPVSFLHRLVILQHTCLFLFYFIKRC